MKQKEVYTMKKEAQYTLLRKTFRLIKEEFGEEAALHIMKRLSFELKFEKETYYK